MWSARALCLCIVALVALAAPLLVAASPARAPATTLARHRRQTLDQANIIDLQAGGEGAGADEGEERTREKRKLEGVTQAKFGIKNAVLGFVFGKINSLIDAKTRFIDTLDKQNIEKNKQYGIEAPQNGLASLSGVVTQVLQPKLQFLGPKLQAVSGLLGGASGGGGGSGGGSGGSGLGSLLSLFTSLSGSSSGGGAGASATATIETADSDDDS